jgi:uncharacterized protein (TIGR03435 family)
MTEPRPTKSELQIEKEQSQNPHPKKTGAAPGQMRKMAQRDSKIFRIVKGLLLVAAEIAAVTWLVVFGDLAATLRAQSAANQASLQAPTVPQWQIDAGGKMAFDVVSVKTNKSNEPPTSAFVLGPGDAYVSNGGRFSATNQPLIAYLAFAYKLRASDLPGLPAWVYNDRFDIEARVQGNPTKDQMRLLMQSLLADRFKLATHSETKPGPAFALVMSKPGKIGPQLQADSGDGCSAAPTPQASGAAPSGVRSATSPTSALGCRRFPVATSGRFPQTHPGGANRRERRNPGANCGLSKESLYWHRPPGV